VGLGVMLIVAAGVALLVPAVRFPLLGWVRGERFHGGRPASYWIYLLENGADKDRESAAHALGRMKAATPEALTALTAALKDKHYIVRRNAAAALSEIGPEAAPAVPALLEALGD